MGLGARGRKKKITVAEMGLKKKKKKRWGGGGGGLEVGGALKKREVIGDKGEILILEALLSMESLY